MTADCDCLAQPAKYVVPDIGVIAGYDPVAIDQAVLDLTKGEGQENIADLSYPAIPAEEQLAYGEKIGLGSRSYNIQTLK